MGQPSLISVLDGFANPELPPVAFAREHAFSHTGFLEPGNNALMQATTHKHPRSGQHPIHLQIL